MAFSKGFRFTLTAALFWAISIVLTKLIVKQGENVFNIAFWLVLFTMPFWLFIFLKNLKEAKQISKKDVKILLAMALISTAGGTIVEILALKFSPAINYSFLIRTIIIFTIIFAYFFLDEKITRKKIILTALILAGAYLLTTNGKLIAFTWGDIFTIIEAALLAFGNTILGKIATSRMSSNLSASASFLIGTIPIALIAILNNAIAFPKEILLIICLAISGIITTTSRFSAYKVATASYVAMIFSATPVFVSIIAMLFLGETLSPIQLAGGILIILAGIAVEKLKI